MRGKVLTSIVGVPLLLAAAAASDASAATSTDWPEYQRNPAHTSAVFADPAITPANAGNLRPAWTFTAAGPTAPGQPNNAIDASPSVVGGRVYIGARTGVFYALDVVTGRVVWKKQLDWGSNAVCPARGIIGTASVQPDPVDGVLTAYVPGAHYLYALNAATGATRWKRAIGPATSNNYYNWSSPTVAGGRIFMGLAASCESKLIRGGVVSLSQHTGALQHSWYAMPKGKVGASVWTSLASDGKSAWVTTGNPDPDGTTINDSYSIVRLAASTLAKQDKWTVPNTQNSDLDFGSSPTLFTGKPNGVSTPMAAACNKNGVLYAWKQNHLAAGPVWQRLVGTTGSYDVGACLPGPAWDYVTHRLFAASNQTTIGGVTTPGGIRALDPSTGAVIWEKSLPCLPVGSPTINGTLVAVPLYSCPDGVARTVKLFRESDGAAVGSVPETGRTFAQPVFAAGKLFVAGEDGTLNAYAP